jgi:signal transduction histidine kinase
MHRPRFYRSIRFRLTAWYTLLLAAILVGSALVLSTLVERQLREDVDDRLEQTAQKVGGAQVRVIRQPGGSYYIDMPVIDTFETPGQVVQVIGVSGQVITQRGDFLGTGLPHSQLNGGNTEIVYMSGDVDGVPVRTLTYPLVTEDDSLLIGGMVVAESLVPLNRTIHLLRELLLIASPVGLVLAAFGGWWLAGRALHPVDRMTATAASIAGGSSTSTSLTERIAVPNTDDEIARLALTFNQMLSRLEEAFDKQQRFVADASHELRTPLTAIRGNIDVLLRQINGGALGQAELTEALEDLRRESARMGRLIQDLLTLARSDANTVSTQLKTPVRLDEVVQDSMRTASGLTDGQELITIPLSEVTIPANRDRLTELVLILVENAIRHTPPDGEICVSLEREAGVARLIVQDTGEGIAPENIPHVFERFFRADKSRDRTSGGTGLGLAIARDIARDHGGDISVDSAVGIGSTFTVRFPIRA